MLDQVVMFGGGHSRDATAPYEVLGSGGTPSLSPRATGRPDPQGQRS